MKALQITGYGNNKVAVVSQDAPLPSIKQGAVLVKVHKAAVNPVDWKMREGSMKNMVPLTFPATLGCDFSGVIIRTGADVTAFKAGDEVFGVAIPSLGGSGSFAEYLVTPAKNICLKPADISHTVAAASVTVSVCAYLCLQEAPIDKHSKILVIGGAGGIGRAAIQLAKNSGAHVAATVHGKDVAATIKAGADEVIDASEENFQDLLKGYDLVVDTVGGEVYKHAFMVLKKGGVIASVAQQPDPALMQYYGVSAKFILGFPFTERLEAIKGLLSSKVLTPHISKTFSLDKGVAALDFQQNSKPAGKVILDIYND